MLDIIIHVIGVIVIIQVITHFMAGSNRDLRSRKALNISVPISVAYIAWLFW